MCTASQTPGHTSYWTRHLLKSLLMSISASHTLSRVECVPSLSEFSQEDVCVNKVPFQVLTALPESPDPWALPCGKGGGGLSV